MKEKGKSTIEIIDESASECDGAQKTIGCDKNPSENNANAINARKTARENARKSRRREATCENEALYDTNKCDVNTCGANKCDENKCGANKCDTNKCDVNKYGANKCDVDKCNVGEQSGSGLKKSARKNARVKTDDEKLTAVQTAGAIWSVLSTAYSVVSVCAFVAKDWVDSVYSYALIPLLVVYVAAFIALVAMMFKQPKTASSEIKTFKKLVGVFKAFANVFFLAITAVSMAGLASGETGLGQWIAFAATLVVALVQLALKITKFVMRCAKRSIGKKYNVDVTNYVDGKRKNKNIADKYKESKYRS